MQGERKTKRKRSFQILFFRTAAYLARSESSANREQKQIKRSLKFDFAEMQPILREAKTAIGGGYRLEVRDKTITYNL